MLLHNDSRFSSDTVNNGNPGLVRYMPRMVRLLTDSMVFKDDPDHARLRRLVNQAFTPRMVQAMSDDIERIVDERLDDLAQNDVVDLVKDFAIPVPLSVISRMLGVSDADRERFSDLMGRLTGGASSGSRLAMVRAIPSGRKLLRIIEDMADLRRTHPDDALISSLVAASEGDDKLSQDEIAAMIFLLMLAGHDTTANLIGSSILTLLEHPEQAERLREDPSLAASAIEELLRFTTPVPCGAARVTMADVEVAGFCIPKGSYVLGMIISANRDEEVFDHADALDVGREPNKHLTFAFGKHFCLGNQLARMEGRVAIRGLLRRFPNMQLALSKEELRYKPSQSLRGLMSLPIRLK